MTKKLSGIGATSKTAGKAKVSAWISGKMWKYIDAQATQRGISRGEVMNDILSTACKTLSKA